jgi:hypothetical protein
MYFSKIVTCSLRPTYSEQLIVYYQQMHLMPVSPPLHTRHIPYIARYATASQPTNEVILLFFTSVALVRNEVCSLRMVELPKHVGAD